MRIIKGDSINLSYFESTGSELSEDAFKLYFKCKLMSLLDTIYYQESENLDNLFKYKFGANNRELVEQSTSIINDYIRIKKKYSWAKIGESAPLYMLPFKNIAPDDSKLIDDIRKMLLQNCLNRIHFYYWLKGYKPDFYDNRQDISDSILNGCSNAKRVFTILSANSFQFEYSGVERRDMLDFSKKLLGKSFHINEIMKMSNESLEPVYIFGAGFGDHCSWEYYI